MSWESARDGSAAHKSYCLLASLVWVAFWLLSARALNLNAPYLPLAIAGALVFYLRNWPLPPELVCWVIVSALFGVVVRFPHNPNWIDFGSFVLALLGLGAFLMLGLRWLWSQGAERRRTYAVLAPAAALVLFVLSAQHALSLANLLYPKTLDLYLYLFDGSFGFQPSFLAGRALASSSILRIAAGLTYISLPFVMAIVYALRLPKGTERPSWDMITLFLLAGIGGWALYNVVPATGPKFVFVSDFPLRSLPYSSLHKLLLEQISVNPDTPRNAIPSLHMAWVVLLCWNGRNLAKGVRIFLAAYLALTVISTMGMGEHYFVDLVAALPFALFVQAAVSPDEKAEFTRRTIAAGSALVLTVAWLLLVRFGAKMMLISPLAPWSFVVATGIAVWQIKAWLEVRKPISEMSAHEKPLAFAAHN